MSLQIINGLLNTAALVVAGVYVSVIPPTISQLNGVPTNIAGFVGTASYGPVDIPIAISDYGSYNANFGPLINRTFDMGTHVAIAVQQGATSIYGVRVTDGTDTAASGKLGAVSSNYAALFTAKYTGSAGNAFTVLIGTSAIANSLKITLTSGLNTPEVFDGITNASPVAFWTALVNAVNKGTTAQRGPSQYFVATLGTLTSTAIPGASTTPQLTLSAGTDGVSSITTSVVVGVDGNMATRTGMYALRATGTSVAGLCDVSDQTSWPTQLSFGVSEQIYMVTSGPAGDNIANAVTTKLAAGCDGYSLKVMFGDWPTWLDTVNNAVRLVSPCPFVVGRLVNLPPQNSALNQQIFNVVGTQTSNNGLLYSILDIQTLDNAGIDVMVNPSPGGQNFFACASGHNASSSSAIWGDNYTRMTNYLARTIVGGGLGTFIGQTITAQLLASEKAVLDNSFNNLKNATPPMIADFQTTITSTAIQQQNGITVITALVQYLAINEKLVVQLQGGQTVSITRQGT